MCSSDVEVASDHERLPGPVRPSRGDDRDILRTRRRRVQSVLDLLTDPEERPQRRVRVADEAVLFHLVLKRGRVELPFGDVPQNVEVAELLIQAPRAPLPGRLAVREMQGEEPRVDFD